MFIASSVKIILILARDGKQQFHKRDKNKFDLLGDFSKRLYLDAPLAPQVWGVLISKSPRIGGFTGRV